MITSLMLLWGNFNVNCFRHLLIIKYWLWVIIKLLSGIISDHEIYLIFHYLHVFGDEFLNASEMIDLVFVLAVCVFDAVDDFLLLKVVGLVEKEELPLHVLVFE